MALLEADVNFKVVKGFVKRVKERAIGQDVLETLTPAQQPDAMKDAALGLVLWGSLAYQQGLYRTAQDSRLALN